MNAERAKLIAMADALIEEMQRQKCHSIVTTDGQWRLLLLKRDSLQEREALLEAEEEYIPDLNNAAVESNKAAN